MLHVVERQQRVVEQHHDVVQRQIVLGPVRYVLLEPDGVVPDISHCAPGESGHAIQTSCVVSLDQSPQLLDRVSFVPALLLALEVFHLYLAPR